MKKNLYTKLFIYFGILLICIILLAILNKTNVSKKVIAKYNLDSNISYNVKHKDGSIANSKLFVSELVDNINVNFTNKYSIDNDINVAYRYEIIAYVISNIDDSTLEETEVYRKEEVLKRINLMSHNSNILNLSDSIDINYDYYNKIAMEYNNSVNLAIKSRLLVVYNLYIVLGDEEEKQYTSSITVPLEKSTFTITKNEDNSKDVIYGKDNAKFIIDIVVISLIAIFIVLIILETFKTNKYKKEHALEFKYRKIMQDYNNVVVLINQIPQSQQLITVKVLYFKSMIDIQKELHLPILCYKSEKFIVYIIINDDLAYVYFLNSDQEKI